MMGFGCLDHLSSMMTYIESDDRGPIEKSEINRCFSPLSRLKMLSQESGNMISTAGN